MGWLKQGSKWQFQAHHGHFKEMTAVAHVVDKDAVGNDAVLWRRSGSVGKTECIERKLMEQADADIDQIRAQMDGRDRVTFYIFVHKTPCRNCAQAMADFAQRHEDDFNDFKLGFRQVYNHRAYGYGGLGDFLNFARILKDWRIRTFTGGAVGGAVRTNDFVWFEQQDAWASLHPA
ncbi:hypothetical protein [Caulobacter sp. 1776]|uniref:hypothetical protein n=1 Tax=Caulobacter sp. 1776 TaxID=3156420 RepID=UPI003397F02A